MNETTPGTAADAARTRRSRAPAAACQFLGAMSEARRALLYERLYPMYMLVRINLRRYRSATDTADLEYAPIVVIVPALHREIRIWSNSTR